MILKHHTFDETELMEIIDENSLVFSSKIIGDAIKAVNKNEVANCSVCFKDVALSKLRQHIARHILLKELNNNAKTCGFCGGQSCAVSIKVTSGVGKKANKGIESNCKYFQRFILKPAETSTKNKPCT